ncbi:MAG: MaoC family dehydratase [Gemmata sp.]|jgi:acyl dehydratase
MSFSSFHLYFDDLEVGQEWASGGRTVTEADIVNFAGFSGDFNPIHIDHEFAKGTPFRRPIAHGFAVFSIASGLAVSSPPARTIALLHVAGWNFNLPVFAGDTLHCVTRVKEKTLRGRGRRGEVIWHRAIVNQDGKVVQDGDVVTLVECRTPAREAGAAAPAGSTGQV